jgi:hypothetical protein
VALDLARAYVGPALRPWQYAAGAAMVAALWSWLGERGQRGRERLPWTALAAFLVPTLVDHTRRIVPGDPVHYYSYLRSLLFDGDLDLSNDYPLLGWHLNAAGILPVGAPLAWSPLVLVVHVARQAARLFGLGPPDGTEPLYQATACLASVLCGVAGLFLLVHTLRRWFTPAVAFWATVCVWVGSPLRFYMAVVPPVAHAAEFLAAVLVLRSFLAYRDRGTARAAALCGAACGFAFLTRPQDGLFLLLPAAELARRLWRGPERAPLLRPAGSLAAGFLVAALPQLAAWQVLHGTPLLVPHQRVHGASFLLDRPELAGALFSPNGGLFASHPVLLLAAIGLLAFVRRDARFVAAAAPVLLGAWYVNASVFDWYHVRRYTGIVPLLAPGLAVVIAPLARAGWVLPALLAFLALRVDLAVDGLRALPGQPAPVRRVVGEAADRLAADVYRVLEPVAPRVAVRALGAYTGERLLDEPVARIDLAGDPALLRLPERARKLSGVEVEDGRPSRWVTDRDARLYLPLAWSGPLVLTVHARALETEEPQSVHVLWNETPVGESPMVPAWSDYRFAVPGHLVRPGTNTLALVFDRGPIYRRARGTGPREVRPAALAWITLHREGEAR